MKDIPLYPHLVVDVISRLEMYLRDLTVQCNDPKRTSETLKQYASDLEDTINRLKVTYCIHKTVDGMSESAVRDAHLHMWEQQTYQNDENLEYVLKMYEKDKRYTV